MKILKWIGIIVGALILLVIISGFVLNQAGHQQNAMKMSLDNHT